MRYADAVHPHPMGIYVHVPFCARRCGYCAFVTYASTDGSTDARHRLWTDAVLAEVAVAQRELSDSPPAITSVYFGGGTPTSIDTTLLAEVLRELRERFDVVDDLEISVEANPDGILPGQTDDLASLGATRISFGMQSAVPRILDLLDRTHDVDSVPRAVAAARASGIAGISLDLIHGTPGETAADWARTVEAALAMEPDHLSAYALSIEAGTKLASRVRDGTLPEPSPDEAADRYEALEAAATAAGLQCYELSNWARRSRDRCRHNLLYWRNGDWWGLGPGAHSHVGDRRWWNHASIGTWSELAFDGVVPAAGEERASRSQQRTEEIMLGIRLDEGIPISWAEPGSLHGLLDDGLVELVVGRVVLTSRGRLLADTVIRTLRWGERRGSPVDQKVVDSNS